MAYAARYACRTCGSEKWLPEHPVTGKRRVRTGFEACGYIQTFKAVGRP